MKPCIRIIVIFLVLALAGGSMVEYFYAGTRQDCSCCHNKCQGAKNCHENTKACLCSYQVPLQVYLLKSETLPKLVFCGFFVPNRHFAYLYLSAEDIFHPPKYQIS